MAEREPSLDACISQLRELVAFPTVSRDSNRDLLEYVAAHLAHNGVTYEILWNKDRTKGNLWATIGPASRRGVILSGHSDVVPVDGQEWTSDPFRLREKDGKLYGRGTCDMKGFIAIALAAVPMMASRKLMAPIHLAISYDEELGCTGVTSLIDSLASLELKPAICIVGEPTNMKVVIGHKGGGMYRVVLTGSSVHSSLAPRGVNAIEYAADLIGFIRGLSDGEARHGPYDDDYDVPHSTISVTSITGGTAINIIPDHCEFGFDIRALPTTDIAAIVERIRHHAETAILPRMQAVHPGSAIRIEPVVEILGLDTDPEHPAVTFMKQLTGSNEYGKVAFATEAGLFSKKAGIASVVCGPGSIVQAHKPDEFIEVSELERYRRMLVRLTAMLEHRGPDW